MSVDLFYQLNYVISRPIGAWSFIAAISVICKHSLNNCRQRLLRLSRGECEVVKNIADILDIGWWGSLFRFHRKQSSHLTLKNNYFYMSDSLNNIKLVTSGKYYLILTNYYPITIVLVKPRWIGSCSISCFCSDGEDWMTKINE